MTVTDTPWDKPVYKYSIEGLSEEELRHILSMLQTYSLTWAKNPAGPMEFEGLVEFRPEAKLNCTPEKGDRLKVCRKLLSLIFMLKESGEQSVALGLSPNNSPVLLSKKEMDCNL